MVAGGGIDQRVIDDSTKRGDFHIAAILGQPGFDLVKR